MALGNELRFLPSHVALRVMEMPPVTPVPGGPPELFGIALVSGVVVPVITVGPERATMVVCQQGGELLGVVGARVVASGMFDANGPLGDVLDAGGGAIPTLDLGVLSAKVKSAGLARLRKG
jgi:hypothetical protein